VVSGMVRRAREAPAQPTLQSCTSGSDCEAKCAQHCRVLNTTELPVNAWSVRVSRGVRTRLSVRVSRGVRTILSVRVSRGVRTILSVRVSRGVRTRLSVS
jgi:hypothetical protein